MPGSQADEVEWEVMTNKELHDNFQQMMADQVQDFVTSLGEAMEKLDGLEKTFETKLDAKFNEVLAHLPPAAPAITQQQQQRRPNFAGRAQRVPLEEGQHSGAGSSMGEKVRAREGTTEFPVVIFAL